MPDHSALSRVVATITRTIRVAAGVFAPGHLGELTPIVPFELVDAILAETSTVQVRLRELPSRVGMYFVLAMCLFPEVGYRQVWAKLICGLDGYPVCSPSAKALRDLRRRIGPRPVKALFEVLAGPSHNRTRPAYDRGCCSSFSLHHDADVDDGKSENELVMARNLNVGDPVVGGGYPIAGGGRR